MSATSATPPQPLPLSRGSWQVIPQRSEFEFHTRVMLGLMRVRGRFSDIEGSLRCDDSGQVSGELRIPVTTLDTGIKKRDAHLRSPDFFEVDAYPEMRFTLTALTPATDGTASLQGVLRIRDHDLQISAPATVATVGTADLRIQASFPIDHHAAGFKFKRLPKTVRISAVITLQTVR